MIAEHLKGKCVNRRLIKIISPPIAYQKLQKTQIIKIKEKII